VKIKVLFDSLLVSVFHKKKRDEPGMEAFSDAENKSSMARSVFHIHSITFTGEPVFITYLLP
jgi:hypothetical protein